MKFDPENPLSELIKSDSNTIQTYFAVESDHMPSLGYSKNPEMVFCRRIASRYIKQYAASGARDPVIPFLAMSYLDNYISSTDVPKTFKGRGNRGHLLTTSCFVSACRMRKPDFSLNNFRIRQNLDFNMDEVVEIEALIDQCLHARKCKRPVTALCFLDYLIGTLPDLNEYKTRCLKNFATHKLYALQYDMRLTEFKPSIIAAAALASSIDTFYKRVHRDMIPKIFKCKHLNAVSLKRAIEMLIGNVKLYILNSAEPKLSHVEKPHMTSVDDRVVLQKSGPRSHGAPTDTAKTMRSSPDRSNARKRRLPPAESSPARKRRLPTAESSPARKRRIIVDQREMKAY